MRATSTKSESPSAARTSLYRRGPVALGPGDRVDAGCAGEREERSGEVFPGIEGAPLSEPLVVLDRGCPSCPHGPPYLSQRADRTQTS